VVCGENADPMSRRQPAQQLIQVGNHQVALPEGVTVADWALERLHWQNPRIRAFLGCIRLLEGVQESNYSLLHCSPERLLDIWSKVRRLSDLIRSRLAPLLGGTSRIPGLEDARLSAALSLEFLAGHVLDRLDRVPEPVPSDQLTEIRKLLCISIGQLHAFLHDTFGEIMAKDPRSLHDSDYFLSRRFPQDIEEAEWLHGTVTRLQEYVSRLEQVRPTHLAAVAAAMRQTHTLPLAANWEGTRVLVDVLLNGLSPKLREVLALRGVRFQEMEILDRYSVEIPTHCRILGELFESSSSAVAAIGRSPGTTPPERAQATRDQLAAQAAASQRIAELLGLLDTVLRDLTAFLPLWLRGIEKRRAMLLRRTSAEGAPSSRLRRSGQHRKTIVGWQRYDRSLALGEREIAFPLPIYTVCELGNDFGFCIILIADRTTPLQQATALVYSWNGDLHKEIDIRDEGVRVRFASCEMVDGLLRLYGDNGASYDLELGTWKIARRERLADRG
jgi:hypothetical protein